MCAKSPKEDTEGMEQQTTLADLCDWWMNARKKKCKGGCSGNRERTTYPGILLYLLSAKKK